MTSELQGIAVVASSSLTQYVLQTTLVGAGYSVVLNTSPERLDKAQLTNTAIQLWVVEINEDDDSSFLTDDLERIDAPILFGDGVVPSLNDDRYRLWRERLLDKLHHGLIRIEPDTEQALFNLPSKKESPSRSTVPSPARLEQGARSELGSVWVLCASLGGPQAVKDFVDALPENVPAAFLYGQHIDAGCVDPLLKSIGRHAGLPLVPISTGTKLQNGHIYFIPVDREIFINERDEAEQLRSAWKGPYGPSHDHLLANVVSRYGHRCHCIIFSGMGEDGAIGAKLVKESGGEVWAQSAQSCVQSSMPDAADFQDAVSWRGSPEDLAQKLVTWLEHDNTAA